jgi:hypothetical protein
LGNVALHWQQEMSSIVAPADLMDRWNILQKTKRQPETLLKSRLGSVESYVLFKV